MRVYVTGSDLKNPFNGDYPHSRIALVELGAQPRRPSSGHYGDNFLGRRPTALEVAKSITVSRKNGQLKVFSPDEDPIRQELELLARFVGCPIKELNIPHGDDNWLGSGHFELESGKIMYPWLPDGDKRNDPRFYKYFGSRYLVAHVIQGYIPPFDKHQIVSSYWMSNTKEKLSALHEGNVKFAESYLEAGNIIRAIKRDGSLGYIIGANSLYLSMLLLDDRGYFPEAKLAAAMAKLQSGSDIQAKLNDLIAKLSNAKKLACDHYSEDLVQCSEHLNWDKYLIQPNDNDETKRKKALSFLAKLELTKEVIARDLEVPSSTITFIDQPYKFHLDLLMNGHPEAGVLIHDDSIAADMLSRLAQANCKQDDKRIMHAYNIKAQDRLSHSSAKMSKIYNQLEAAGYDLFKVPAVFGAETLKNRVTGKLTVDAEEQLLLNSHLYRTAQGDNVLVAFGARVLPVLMNSVKFLFDAKLFDKVVLLGDKPSDSMKVLQPFCVPSDIMATGAGGLKCLSLMRRT